MGERELARSMFGGAIDYDAVRVHQRKYWLFHSPRITMAPDGHLWFHPLADHYCADFCVTSLAMQGHFIHEMTHVWQAQSRGKWYLPLMRHPWCRYAYRLRPGKPFAAYGIEQQAEIMRHAFLHRHNAAPPEAPPADMLAALLPFPGT